MIILQRSLSMCLASEYLCPCHSEFDPNYALYQSNPDQSKDKGLFLRKMCQLLQNTTANRITHAHCH